MVVVADQGEFVVTSQAAVARFFGVQSATTVQQWLSKGCPGTDRHYDLSAITAWVRARDHEKAVIDLAGSDPDLEVGEESPALEKLRHEKWLRERLKRQAEEGEYVRVEDIRRGLLDMVKVIRDAGVTIQRQFGPEAAEPLIDALQGLDQGLEAVGGAVDESISE